MIRLWLKMKKNEIKVKLQFYSALMILIDNNKDIIAFVQRLYEELKDVPTEKLKEELISTIAKLSHEQAIKEREMR